MHEITPDGESTAAWACRRPCFMGSIAQLTCCARCGNVLPAKPHNEPRRFGMGPVIHVLCDDCYDALPD